MLLLGLTTVNKKIRTAIVCCLLFSAFFFLCIDATTALAQFDPPPTIGDNPALGTPNTSSGVGPTVTLSNTSAPNETFWEKSIKELLFTVATVLGGAVLTVGGMFLDLSVQYTVLGMGKLLAPQGQLGLGVTSMWGLVRDILNILFIFGLIYIGIKTILNADDSGTQKKLGLLIVAALLVNFSLYFTQLIADFTNIAAIQVHNQIVGTGGNDAFSVGGVAFTKSSTAGAFLNVASVGSWLGNDSGTLKNLTLGTVFFYSILMMVFLVTAGIVFALGAILLLVRFGTLVLYMIFSPLMFAGWIFPAAGSAAGKFWTWEGYLKQAFFAPAFLFMLYLSLVVLQRLQETFGVTGKTYSSIIASGSEAVQTFNLIIFFGLMLVLLFASVKIAGMMGIAGASTAMGALNTAKSATQGFMYRKTGGRFADDLLQGFDALDKKTGLLKGVYGQRARNSLTAARNYKAGGGMSIKDVEDEKKSSKKGRSARHVEEANEAYTKKTTTDIKTKITAGTKEKATEQEKIDMERAVLDASGSHVLEMIKGKDKDQVMAVAGLLSEGQVKAITDDKEIDETVKNAFLEERATQVEVRLKKKAGAITELQPDGTPEIDPATGQPKTREAGQGDAVSKADITELKSLGFKTAVAHAGRLSAKQIEDWKDLTPTEKDLLKNKRKDALIAEFGEDGINAGRLFKQIGSDSERAKLPKEILTASESVPYLNTNVLSKITENDSVSESDRALIKNNILTIPGYFPLGTTVRNNDKYKKMYEFFNKNQAGMRY